MPNQLKSIILAGVIASSSACSNDGSNLNWTEDVLLPDGRQVTLTRHYEFKGPHQPGQPPTESKYWIEFTSPSTGERVRWNGEREIRLLALMMNGSKPMLLTEPTYQGPQKYNYPYPSYLLYEYEQRQWKALPLESIPYKRIKANITVEPQLQRSKIEAESYHLTTKDTTTQIREYRPLIFNFSELTKQTFGRTNRPAIGKDFTD